MDIEIIEKQRNAFKQFMEIHKLKMFPWAKKAGISEATIRNYLTGRNQSLTSVTLEKLANAARAPLSDLLGEITNSDIDKNMFIQSFIDMEEFLAQSGLNLEPKVKATALLAWYELAKILEKDPKALEIPQSLNNLMTNIMLQKSS